MMPGEMLERARERAPRSQLYSLNVRFSPTPMAGVGRLPKITNSKIESAKRLLARGVAPNCVAKNLGVSIPTLYRWVPVSAHA